MVPAAGAQTLTVYFTKKLLGDLAVSVAASQARDKPAVSWRSAAGASRRDREEGLVAVIAPESFELKTDAARLRGARAATPAELTAKNFQPPIPPARRWPRPFPSSRGR